MEKGANNRTEPNLLLRQAVFFVVSLVSSHPYLRRYEEIQNNPPSKTDAKEFQNKPNGEGSSACSYHDVCAEYVAKRYKREI